MEKADFERVCDPLTKRFLMFYSAKHRVVVLVERGVYRSLNLNLLETGAPKATAIVVTNEKPAYLPD